MAERGESLRDRRLGQVKVLMVKTQKTNWKKTMVAVHGIVSTVSIEKRGDSLRRVIDSKCPLSNHLSNVGEA
jgi:organic hydroperoxide reductase OsmC/OhrA